jgi:FkbM family methyltransferase
MARLSSTLIGVRMASVALVAGMACSDAGTSEDLAQFMAREKSLYAQNQLGGNEEVLVRHFFGDKKGGFYVDIGCSDYKINSTTYYLEEHLGWSGIGVDALKHLRGGWKKHRPRSKFFAYAVTDKTGETITFFQAGGLSAAEIDTKNLEAWQEQIEGLEPREVEVPTITINDLLDREGVTKIDFLSMDINGAEPIALAGFDIERFAPKLVHVEASPHRHAELKAYFAEHDYARIDAYQEYDMINWYFTPKESK